MLKILKICTIKFIKVLSFVLIELTILLPLLLHSGKSIIKDCIFFNSIQSAYKNG